MERMIIKEPQLSYFLELFVELGDAANNFILVGAQAMRFFLEGPRYTKDFDFILDVIALRNSDKSIADALDRLQYEPVPESRMFQFVKMIPSSNEILRIEFLGSDKERRDKNFRVDVQHKGGKVIHARACTGAELLLKESDMRTIEGSLPNGKRVSVEIRVARPSALLMLKLFAMEDRYSNPRGQREARHDREEARIHAADIIDIVGYGVKGGDFVKCFWSQFDDRKELKDRAMKILTTYFKDLSSPGIVLYGEFLKDQSLHGDLEEKQRKALREVQLLLV